MITEFIEKPKERLVSLADGSVTTRENGDAIAGRALAGRLNEEAESIIDAYLYKKLDSSIEQFASGRPGAKVTKDEIKTVIIGFALRKREMDIVKLINDARAERGEPLVNKSSIGHYRVRYAEIIDEIWATVFVRIGEVYSFADKTVRVGRMNELAEAVHPQLLKEVKNDAWTKETAQKGAFFINLMRLVNMEMGGLTHAELIQKMKPKTEKDEEDEPEETTGVVIKEILGDRWSAQLPEAISRKVGYTDYTNCALGERMGDKMLCWSESVVDNRTGDSCAVQEGVIETCPFFLNKSLLDNKDFLVTCRQRAMTVKDIGIVCGAKNYNSESRGKVLFYLKKHEVKLEAVSLDKDEHRTDTENQGEIDSPTG
jgi:hypothetical protein